MVQVPSPTLDRIRQRLMRVLEDDLSAVLDNGVDGDAAAALDEAVHAVLRHREVEADHLNVLEHVGMLFKHRFLASTTPDERSQLLAVTLLEPFQETAPPSGVSRAAYFNVLAGNLVASLAPRDRTALLAAVAILQLAAWVAEAREDALRSVSNLAYMLSELYEASGDVLALTEATRLAYGVLAETDPGTVEYARSVHRLADMLRLSYAATADAHALEELIRLLQSAVGGVPPESPEYADLVLKLAEGMRLRYSATGDTRAMRESVRMLRRLANQLPTDHPAYARTLNNLATELRAQLGKEAFEEVIDLYQAALVRTASGDEFRAHLLSNLAGVLADHAKETGTTAGLDEALSMARQAIAEIKVPATAHVTLAIILGIRHELTGDTAALDEATHVLRSTATQTLDEHDRARALHWFAVFQNNRYFDTRAEADARTAAAAWLEAAEAPGTSVREHAQGVTAAAKIHAELHEWSRATELIGQVVDLLPAVAGRQLSRGDREEGVRLFRVLPAIAAEYAVSAGMPDLALELVERTRNVLSAGDDTRLPLSHLLNACRSGPVVLPVAGLRWSGAFIVTVDGIRQVKLPQLTPDSVISQSTAYLGALDTVTSRRSTAGERRQAEGAIRSFLGWLWDAITGPVLDALGFACPSAPGMPLPRIWWCPIAYLSYVPLHAAGRPGSPNALDLVISSYTSSLQSMHGARPWIPGSDTRSLMVAMPHTPGLSDLPGVEQEIPVFVARFPGCRILRGTAATRARVLAALPDHDIVHFACHGGQDPDHDYEVRLFVHDGVLGLADIARTRDDRPGLAFLSACSTAQKRLDLPDEALSLATQFQLAGFSHVVGSLWPIGDQLSHQVMTDFYDSLLTDGSVAKALHLAVSRLMKAVPDQPSVWTPYVHYGP